jgi:hypothetical protein
MKVHYYFWIVASLFAACSTENETNSQTDFQQPNDEFVDKTNELTNDTPIHKLDPQEYAEQWDYFIMVIEDNLPFDWENFVAIEGVKADEIANNFRDPFAFDMIAQYGYEDLPYAYYEGEQVKEIIVGAVDAEGVMHGYYYYFAERPNGLKLVGWAAY